MTKEQHAKRAATAFLQRLNEEHEEWCGLRFSSQEGSKRPPELQEKYPYPGLVNLGDTCYLNAVCQVLLHCDAARVFLRSGAEVPGDADADEDAEGLSRGLQNLAQNFVDGFPTGFPGQRCHVDCWSPHALIDAFLECRALELGKQHGFQGGLGGNTHAHTHGRRVVQYWCSVPPEARSSRPARIHRGRLVVQKLHECATNRAHARTTCRRFQAPGRETVRGTSVAGHDHSTIGARRV